MNDAQRAEQELISRGFLPGSQATITHEDLKSWMVWSLAEGRKCALVDEHDRLLRLQKAAKPGDNPIYCTVCDQKIRKLNPHSMDKAKIRMLMSIAILRSSGIDWVRVKAGDTIITPSGTVLKTVERASAQATYLKWFRLLASRGSRSGEYEITQRGIEFLKGQTTVPEKIWCREGLVVYESQDHISIDQVDVEYNKLYWDQYSDVQAYVPV